MLNKSPARTARRATPPLRGRGDDILLLYEPHSRLVLMTFDYT